MSSTGHMMGTPAIKTSHYLLEEKVLMDEYTGFRSMAKQSANLLEDWDMSALHTSTRNQKKKPGFPINKNKDDFNIPLHPMDGEEILTPNQKTKRKSYRAVCLLENSKEVMFFSKRNYNVLISVGLTPQKICPVQCVIDTGAGPT